MSNTSELIQEMQVYYSRRAADYDASMGYDQPEIVAQLSGVINRLRQLVAGKKVLEIACGPCFWTQHIYDCTHSILATDYNQSTLDQAALKRLPTDKVQLRQADAYHLVGIPSGFDVVLAIDWFAHVPQSNIPSFLEGLHQHLHGQGLVIFCDQLPGSHSWTGKFDADGNHLQERTLENDASYTVIKHFFSEQDIEAIFTEYTAHVSIEKFTSVRRVLIHYHFNPNL